MPKSNTLYLSEDGCPFGKQVGEKGAILIEKVWELYNFGVPLFTKAQLRDVGGRLDNQAKTVLIEGIDGVRVSHDTIRRGKDLQG